MHAIQTCALVVDIINLRGTWASAFICAVFRFCAVSALFKKTLWGDGTATKTMDAGERKETYS